MIDDATLERGLRSRPPVDPVYRSRIGTAPLPGVGPRPIAAGRPSGWPQRALDPTRLVPARLILALAIVGAGSAALVFAASQVPSPALVSSPQATGSAPPPATPDLVAGLVTTEVEPGVLRVDNDGVRDLRWLPPESDTSLPYCCHYRNAIAFSPDLTPWFFRPEGFFRLGASTTHRWSDELLPWGWCCGFEVASAGPDGSEMLFMREDGYRRRRAVADSTTPTWLPIPQGDPWAAGPARPVSDVTWSLGVVEAGGAGSRERWTRRQNGESTDFEAPAEVPRFNRSHDGGVDHQVAPDGALWFNARNEAAGDYGHCDGLARFDGVQLTRYLRGLCLYNLSIGPDGSVWVLAGADYWLEHRPPVETYLIPAEVAMAPG